MLKVVLTSIEHNPAEKKLLARSKNLQILPWSQRWNEIFTKIFTSTHRYVSDPHFRRAIRVSRSIMRVAARPFISDDHRDKSATPSRGSFITRSDVSFQDRTVFLLPARRPPPLAGAPVPRRNLVNALRSPRRFFSLAATFCASRESTAFLEAAFYGGDAAGKLQRDKSLKSLKRRLQNAGWRDNAASSALLLARNRRHSGKILSGKIRIVGMITNVAN